MRVAFLTAGGIAPCLSASLGRLIFNYSRQSSNVTMIGYLNGYKGLLKGQSISIGSDAIENIETLYEFGGSPLGNSRVKLTNIDDCLNNGYIKKGQEPLKVAADQLVEDEVDVLHTIGGDDTNTAAGDLVSYLSKNNYNLTVVGLPKTIDNDVFPIKQTLGAFTAAEQGAIFFENVVNENTTSSRQLIIHEVMGRNCGWLTAATAQKYRSKVLNKTFLPSLLVSRERWDVDAIYIPEMNIDFEKEYIRLKSQMDKKDCVNIFLSEGAGIENILNEMSDSGYKISKDAFGHVRLDEINPGKWFAEIFYKKLNADKVLVQKSGYFARSANSNKEDLGLIFKTVDFAIQCALNRTSGVVGIDENNGKMSCIAFNRIRGGKPFDFKVDWFQKMLKEIGQI